MFDAAGGALYVGKARDLRKRVSNYFQKSAHETRIASMVSQVARVETTVTRSEGEALLLENNLIKALEPRYNILFRDDKSYPYICITGETFAQLRFHRGTLDRENRYFGPFPGAGAVREGIALLQKVFQLRVCENSVFANRSRPCMLYQIQRCTAPCVGHISEADYRSDVESAELFLQGKTDVVLAQLQQQMDAASTALEFERAARVRDKITRINQLQSRQFVESATAGDIDVVATVSERGLTAVNVVMVRGGRHVGDRTWFPQHADGVSIADVVAAFLAQHYLERPVPPTIVVPDAEDIEALADVLSAQAARKVEIVLNPGGERRVWLTMASQNATLAIAQRLAQKATQEERLAALQQALGLPPTAQRIECFDVSHTMGEAAVASCVIFDKLAMRNSEYRKFNVKPVQGGDDYAAMREALARRYSRIVAGEYPPPDLLVIDGGKGQVNIAAEVLMEQGLHGVPVIGIAKGPERKPGLEDIVFPGPRRRAQPAIRPSGAAPAAADPRRGASLRDPGTSRAPRQGAHHVVAAGDQRHRRHAAQGAARALRRPARHRRGERRRPVARARHQPCTRAADLHAAALAGASMRKGPLVARVRIAEPSGGLRRGGRAGIAAPNRP